MAKSAYVVIRNDETVEIFRYLPALCRHYPEFDPDELRKRFKKEDELIEGEFVIWKRRIITR